jgi:hypothetical protein
MPKNFWLGTYTRKGLSESKGSKGSKQGDYDTYPIENTIDIPTTLLHSKGSNGAPVGRPPQFCPGCVRQVTWLIRGSKFVCSKCKTEIPRH